MIFHAAKAAAAATAMNQTASIALEPEGRTLAVLAFNGAKRHRDSVPRHRLTGLVAVWKRRLRCSRSRNQEPGAVCAPVCSNRNLSAQATKGRNISWS